MRSASRVLRTSAIAAAPRTTFADVVGDDPRLTRLVEDHVRLALGEGTQVQEPARHRLEADRPVGDGLSLSTCAVEARATHVGLSEKGRVSIPPSSRASGTQN